MLFGAAVRGSLLPDHLPVDAQAVGFVVARVYLPAAPHHYAFICKCRDDDALGHFLCVNTPRTVDLAGRSRTGDHCAAPSCPISVAALGVDGFVCRCRVNHEVAESPRLVALCLVHSGHKLHFQSVSARGLHTHVNETARACLRGVREVGGSRLPAVATAPLVDTRILLPHQVPIQEQPISFAIASVSGPAPPRHCAFHHTVRDVDALGHSVDLLPPRPVYLSSGAHIGDLGVTPPGADCVCRFTVQ